MTIAANAPSVVAACDLIPEFTWVDENSARLSAVGFRLSAQCALIAVSREPRQHKCICV